MRQGLALAPTLAVLVLALVACRRTPSDDAPPAGSAKVQAAILSPSSDGGAMTGASQALATHAETKAKLHARSQPSAGEIVGVPGRTFSSGSMPGDDGRDPTIEPALAPVTLTTFSIDALPYPNDPSQPPRTGVSRVEAQQLCEARGERLCSELEWELACKGPELEMFATGDGWDTACDREPATCASGYGARAMGVLREWTASTVGQAIEGQTPWAAVRGAGELSADAGTSASGAHRCARRTREKESKSAPDLGFRCCKGTPNTAQIGAIQRYAGFRPANVDAPRLAKIFGTIPELAALKDVRLYDAEHIAQVADKVPHGVEVTGQPMLWSPEPGAELLVATGRTKSMSFVVALYPLSDDNYRLASYFLMLGDVAPVALAYEPTKRENLLWSSCWGCNGEQGSIRVRDDHRVVIVQY